MADIVQSNYEELENIQSRLQARLERLSTMTSTLRQRADNLCSEGWLGLGADAFKGEMDSLVIPKLTRLCNAYEVGHSTIGRIMATFEEAETDASRAFETDNA